MAARPSSSIFHLESTENIYVKFDDCLLKNLSHKFNFSLYWSSIYAGFMKLVLNLQIIAKMVSYYQTFSYYK